jgi:RHS repeat-associated protein
VQERYRYSPYGAVTVLDANFGARSATAIGNSVTYTGRQLDAETDLYYYRNRYYHAQLGGFVSRGLARPSADPADSRGPVFEHHFECPFLKTPFPIQTPFENPRAQAPCGPALSSLDPPRKLPELLERCSLLAAKYSYHESHEKVVVSAHPLFVAGWQCLEISRRFKILTPQAYKCSVTQPCKGATNSRTRFFHPREPLVQKPSLQRCPRLAIIYACICIRIGAAADFANIPTRGAFDYTLTPLHSRGMVK